MDLDDCFHNVHAAVAVTLMYPVVPIEDFMLFMCCREMLRYQPQKGSSYIRFYILNEWGLNQMIFLWHFFLVVGLCGYCLYSRLLDNLLVLMSLL